MYLSRLTLNPRNAGARRDVARPYELHRTLMRGTDGADTPARLLYRLEPDAEHAPVVLVQSDEAAPDWTALTANGYLLRADGPKPFTPGVTAGQRLRFRLVANPTKKVDGRRLPLVHAVHENDDVTTYFDWLHRKAGQHGFTVLHAEDAPFRTAPRQRKPPAKGETRTFSKHEIPHFGVRFDGVLQVDDPDALVDAVRRGIGPAKAFGFGLLSLAPYRG